MNTYIKLFNDGFSDGNNFDLKDYEIDDNIELIVLNEVYNIDYNEIVYCVNNSVPSEKLLEYYNECERIKAIYKTLPSFRHWLKGAEGLKEDSRYWNRNYRIIEMIYEEMKNGNK